MVFFHKHCVTKKLYHKVKRRVLNKTRKQPSALNKIRNNPTKYLTVDELYTQQCDGKNDILNHVKTFSFNHSKHHKKYKKRLLHLSTLRDECVKSLGKQNIQNTKKQITSFDRDKRQKHQDLLDIDLEYYLYKELGKQYENIKLCHFCKHYDVLHIDKLSKHFDYLDIQSFSYNPSRTCFSFCIDFIGNRNYHFFVKDVYGDKIKYVPLHKHGESFVSVHQTLQNHLFRKQMGENYIWIDDDTILYIANNKYYNTSACYTYHFQKKQRKLIYSDKNHRELSLCDTHSGFYVILHSSSYHSDEVYIIDITDHKSTQYKIAKCIKKPFLRDKSYVLYPYIDHIDATWYILRDNKGEYTFMKTMDFQNFEILFQKKTKGLFIKDVYYMNEMFIFFYRHKSSSSIFTFNNCNKKLSHVKEPQLCLLQKSCHLEVMNFIPQQNKLYFYSSSFTNQNRLFVLELDKSQNKVIEEIEIGLKVKAPKYEEKVIYLKENTIQITMIYKKGLVLHHCKCLVYGYGAYGDHYDAVFNANKLLSLCDKGFVVVIAHISGDRTLSFDQRKNGMFMKKKNTFHDFIYVIENYLFKQQITSRDKLAIWGRSAGGLLIGAVLNMRPDICKVAIMGVPFVSPYLAMLNHRSPLSFESHSEWGDPRKKEYSDFISSYSPYQNIKPDGNYPNLFIYSNLNDTLVPYTEPYIYYKSLKKDVTVYQKEEKELLLHIEDKFGHIQGSSKKDIYDQYSLIFAFLDKHIK